MADMVPDYGIDEWRDWEDVPREFMLLLSTFDIESFRTVQFVTDLLPWELTVPGYIRYTAASPTRFVNPSTHMVEYAIDPFPGPYFGIADPGESYGCMAAFKPVTDEFDSPIVGYWDLPDQATAGVPIYPYIGPSGIVHVARQAD